MSDIFTPNLTFILQSSLKLYLLKINFYFLTIELGKLKPQRQFHNELSFRFQGPIMNSRRQPVALTLCLAFQFLIKGDKL